MEQVQQIKLADLRPSKYNPRTFFDSARMTELVESIKASGVRTPLIVRSAEQDIFEVVAGERRYRASKEAGLKQVPCIVRELTDEQAREEQILENLQREGISPIEEAEGFQGFLKVAGENGKPQGEKVTVDKLAQRIGKSKRYVHARLELLGLAPKVKGAVEAGKISPSHAQELVPLKPDQQAEMLETLTDEYEPQLSVQQLRDEIAQRYRERPKPPQLSAKEKARRAKDAKAAQQREAKWKRDQDRSKAERELRRQANRRALSLLWPKLRAGGARDRLLDWVLDRAAHLTHEVAAAILIAQGEAVPEHYISVEGKLGQYFHHASRHDKLALVALGLVIEASEYGQGDKMVEPLFRWAKVDRKAIARQIQQEAATKAKAELAKGTVQTSAQAAKAGQAGGRARRNRAKIAHAKAEGKKATRRG